MKFWNWKVEKLRSVEKFVNKMFPLGNLQVGRLFRQSNLSTKFYVNTS